MANYAVTTWYSNVKPIDDVLDEIETKLETLDSTTNSIVMSGVMPIGDGKFFIGWIVYNG